MTGNSSLINHKVKNNPECLIQKVGDKDAIKIIDVIQDEFWKEFRRLMLYSPAQVIQIKFLGSFIANNRSLRGHIRKLIKDIRKLKGNEFFGIKMEGILQIAHDTKIRELKACWQQLEEIRKVFIMRNIAHNKNCRKKGTPEKARLDYEKYNYKFLNEK